MLRLEQRQKILNWAVQTAQTPQRLLPARAPSVNTTNRRFDVALTETQKAQIDQAVKSGRIRPRPKVPSRPADKPPSSAPRPPAKR